MEERLLLPSLIKRRLLLLLLLLLLLKPSRATPKLFQICFWFN